MPVVARMNGMYGQTRVNTSGFCEPQEIAHELTPTMIPWSVSNGPPASPLHVPIPSGASVQSVPS